MGTKTPQRTSRQFWLVPEAGQTEHGPVADVALETRTSHMYTYAVPTGLAPLVRPGVRVRVPYGRGGRLIAGWCVRTAVAPWDHTHRPIADVVNPHPLLTPALVELGLWISEYYVCPPGLTLAAMVPAPARRPLLKRVRYITRTDREPPAKLPAKQQAILAALTHETAIETAPGIATWRWDDVRARANAGKPPLDALVQLGLVAVETRMDAVAPEPSPSRAALTPCPEDSFALTPGQQAALDQVVAAAATPDLFRVVLLFGPPGSGKTEVYVRAIRRIIADGRQAIMLVPEIALATQIVDRLARRFERVAVLHGRLSPRIRRETSHAIATGAIDVVIGTRSALFAPLPQLGLIIVDEEQDGSFKNMAAPYYHARDVAIKRAQLQRIACVLGSATPALETWHNAQTLPHYQLLRLTERPAGARQPEIRLVDTRAPDLGETRGVLSSELRDRLIETIAAGNQAILLHNRRGYAVYLRCRQCGLIVTCPRCTARLVFHQPDTTARCHRCGLREPAPTTCLDSTCAGRLERSGLAIQRLEEEVARTVPQARLLRLDRDTMRRAADYAESLQRFEQGAADVLLGTQMVAKGLDFPRVRLVGVIEADAALSLPDFRAAEHVFQLVTQVVGRAGRREGPSSALVQTTEPAVPALRFAVRLDYESFAQHELAVRQRFTYPPFARLARLILADARPGRARDETQRLAQQLRDFAARAHPAVRIEEPSPCVIPRLRSRQRWEVLLRGPRDATVPHFLRDAAEEKLLSPRVQALTIDVDPLEML